MKNSNFTASVIEKNETARKNEKTDMTAGHGNIPYRTKLQAASDSETYQEILSFRRDQYRDLYPDAILNDVDVHDPQSVILYTRDMESGMISSTARIAMDGKNGLPEETILRPILVQHGLTGNFAEIGRFIIASKTSNVELLKSYYRAFYYIAMAMDISAYLLVARRKEIPFYQKRVNARLLCEDIGTSFGSTEHRFCVLYWPIARTGAALLNWIR